MFDDTWGLADDFGVMMKNGKILSFHKNNTFKKNVIIRNQKGIINQLWSL